MIDRWDGVKRVVGIDYSGAAKSGLTAWAARCDIDRSRASRPLILKSLRPIGRLAGADDRDSVNRWIAESMGDSPSTIFAMDFPFGLPIELDLGDWRSQLALVRRFDGDAKRFGRHLVDLTRDMADQMHVRRLTDRETATPFDCYHYRIIYQTFHGMRDVLRPVADDPGVVVLPFDPPDRALRGSPTVVVEACPSSTLKRLGLPHQIYKQSGGRPPEATHIKNRQRILRGIQSLVDLSRHRRGVVMSDPGGDALDAVLAAVGGWHGVRAVDPNDVWRHPRYRLEGRVYA